MKSIIAFVLTCCLAFTPSLSLAGPQGIALGLLSPQILDYLSTSPTSDHLHVKAEALAAALWPEGQMSFETLNFLAGSLSMYSQINPAIDFKPQLDALAEVLARRFAANKVVEPISKALLSFLLSPFDNEAERNVAAASVAELILNVPDLREPTGFELEDARSRGVLLPDRFEDFGKLVSIPVLVQPSAQLANNLRALAAALSVPKVKESIHNRLLAMARQGGIRAVQGAVGGGGLLLFGTVALGFLQVMGTVLTAGFYGPLRGGPSSADFLIWGTAISALIGGGVGAAENFKSTEHDRDVESRQRRLNLLIQQALQDLGCEAQLGV